jgi:hypothetical protein
MPRSARPRRRLPVVLLGCLALAVAAGALLLWIRPTALLGASSDGSDGTPAGGTATDTPYDGSLDGPAAPATSASSGGTAPGSATTAGSPRASSSAPAKREVQVTTTYYGWDDATSAVTSGAFVTGVIEDGGSCTLTLTKAGSHARGTAEGVSDVTTTSCGQISVPGSELTAGTWSGVVVYDSPGAAGRSAAFSVDVP